MDSERNPAENPSGPADWMDRLQGASALCALVFAGLLMGSGIGLAMAYVPSPSEAFDSVLYLRQQGGLGAILRALHYHLASGVVVATFLMVIFGVLGTSHRQRKWEFRLMVVAMLLMIGFCFTGYVLPMDQPAYWGTSVRLGIVGTVPVVGEMQADMLRGGPTFGAATLPRFYALHVAALPIVMVLLVLVGFKDALERAARADGVRLIAACGLISIAAWVLAATVQAPLEPRAATADTEYVPRPEWYFLWLFQFGKYVHGFQWVESALLPVLGIGTLVLLPEFRISSTKRTAGVLVLLTLMFGLGSLALYEDRDLKAKPQYEAGLALKAARHYKVECSGCHGESGKGDGPDGAKLDARPKNFTRADFWDDGTLAEIVEVTTKGEAPDMPAFGGRLSAEEILAIARHVEANFRPRAATSR
ncbi:MAG: cytochrome b N-terminal domain-containing protein [Vicinamibacteria bacterium]|nr:cytochrome b N-terminal domain-containing protein [Vicinamibacteria bacterium]